MKSLHLMLIVGLALVGMVALSSCTDNSGLSGAAITQPTSPPAKPPIPPQQPTTPPGNTLPTQGAANDTANLQTLRNLVVRLNPDLAVKIATIIRNGQLQEVSLDDINAELYTAGCLECVDQFGVMAEITHLVVASGLVKMIPDPLMQQTVTFLDLGKVVPVNDAAQWILDMQKIVTDLLQQNSTTPVGSRTGQLGGSNVGSRGGRNIAPGAPNSDVVAAIALLKQMGIGLNGGLDNRIATILSESKRKTVTYEQLVAMLNPVCKPCVTELGHVRDATQALLDDANLVPIRDARLRGTAEAFVSNQPVSAVDLASWIKGLQKYLAKLKP